MKLLTSTTLLLISGFVAAEDYQSITQSSYSQVDINNTRLESYRLRSTYYFDKKSNLGPLDQFEFINKTSNIFGAYSYLNGQNDKLNSLDLGGEVFFDNVLIGGTYRHTDHDNYGDFKTGTLKLGYLFNDKFMVRATALHTEGADTSYYFDASYNH